MATITPRGSAVPGAPAQAPRQTIQANTNKGRSVTTPPVSPPDTGTQVVTPPAQVVTLPPQVSALARKEAAFQAKVQAFEAEKKSWAEKNAPPVARALPTREETLKTPSKLFEQIGLSQEELTAAYLAEQNGIDPTQQAIQGLEDKFTKLEAKQQEDQAKTTQTIIKQYEAEIAKLVDSDPEYEVTKAKKAHGHVLQHILDTFSEDGDILTVEQAAKEVEEAILADAVLTASLKKVQAKLVPPVAAQDPKQRQTLPPPNTTPRPQAQRPTLPAPAVQPEVPQKQMQHLTMAERLQLAKAKANARFNQR